MMAPSPDPPRDRDQPPNSDDDPVERILVPVWEDEDDIFRGEDGPYELDVGGSDDESDFSDNEATEITPSSTNVNSTEPGSSSEGNATTTTRGYYRLLIPFPVDTVEGIEEDIPVTTAPPGDNHNQYSAQGETKEEGDAAAEVPSSKRDIALTPENVEIIKSAMKTFTLSSIPTWASDVSDDSWKNHLRLKLQDQCQNNDNSNGSK